MSEERDKKPGLVPRLRFPEFREAGEWRRKMLGSIAEFASGSTPSKQISEYWGGKIPWISASSMYETNICKSDLNITDLAVRDGARIAKPGTLLILVRGSMLYNRVPMGVATVDVSFNQDVKALTIKDEVSTVFLLYELLAYESKIPVDKTGIGAGKIETDKLKKLPIYIPSSIEQQKIADCLSSLDEKITAETQKLDALKTHKKGLMQQLFPVEGETLPRLRFPEFREAGEWREKAVGEIFRVTRGEVLAMSLVKDAPSAEFPYPVYSSQTKNKGLAGYYSEYLYEDAITWTTDGANAGEVNFRPGKFYCTNVCGVLLDLHGNANACIAALLNSVTRKYVSYVGNPKLMNGVMSEIVIPFPSIPEQQKIADFLTSLDDLIAAQAQKIELLKRHKKGLMQQLFPVLDEVSA